MAFRAGLASVVVSALFGVAMATPRILADDWNDTNTTAPTSAPTQTPRTTTTELIPKGANCITVASQVGFEVGNYVNIGADTTNYLVTQIHTVTNCGVATARRLGAPVAGTSFSITPVTTQAFPAGTQVAVNPTTPPVPAPTPPGQTVTVSAIVKGSTCVPLLDLEGFALGNTIQFGTTPELSELRVILTLHPNDLLCGRTPSTRRTRRLGDETLGSVALDDGVVNDYPAGTPVKVVTPPDSGSSCFPGDATVDVHGRGATNMASLSVGDRVHVGSGDFEPVLSFLHKVPGAAQALTIVHAHGTFRASENHIVFTNRGDMPASALRPGDELLVQSGCSPILGIATESTITGMYAPFTASGALVVDGVVASNYGTPSSKVSLPHAAAHAAFFSLRVYHYLDLATVANVICSLAAVVMVPHLRLYKL